MSAPAKFLGSLAQSLSTMMLYPRGHPTWERAVDTSYAQLAELRSDEAPAQFSFIGSDVIFGQTPLHEMKDWPWAQKLADVGIQRLEFDGSVDRAEYENFVAEVLARIVQSGAGGSAPPITHRQSIRFGTVTVRDAGAAGGGFVGASSSADAETIGDVPFAMDEEASAVGYLFDQVAVRDVVPVVEADAVVRSLGVAMRGSSAMIIPLLRLKASDPYNAIHSINVAVLAMALAESLGLGNREVHEIGTAALLHDLGMARVPREVLVKPIELTDEERLVIERHPVDGARIILASDKRMELAAAVAYEHHLRPDGTGYPPRLFPRPAHFASRLVRVCSVYNALRIERAHRQAYPPGRALVFIDERAGRDFDAQLATAFTAMMRRLEPHITEVERDARLVTPPMGLPAITDADLHH